jgi:Zn-dependent protease
MLGANFDVYLYTFSVAIIPVLFAITVHEVAHGWVARYYGDRTAERAGRLTLNPINHVDPIGTVAVPLLLLFSGSPWLFGWAKPVPVIFRNLRNPRRDMIVVAAAGPASNLIMALGWSLLAASQSVLLNLGEFGTEWLNAVCRWGIVINVILAVFNMLPIPPLDGGRVATGLLPPRAALALHRLEPFGFIIVLALMWVGVLWAILDPIRLPLTDFFWSVAGFR